MKKFTTEIKPFDALVPGDVIVSRFCLRFRSLERVGTDHVCVTLESETGEITRVTYHSSNRPEVATGYTREYRAAYPHHSFP